MVGAARGGFLEEVEIETGPYLLLPLLLLLLLLLLPPPLPISRSRVFI